MTSVNWTNAISGDWANAANWTGGVPTAATDAVIDAAGAYQATLSTTVSAKSLTLNAVGATFLDSGSLNLGGPLNISAGTFNLDAAGSLGWSSGAGLINLAGGATLQATGTHTLDNVQISMGTPSVGFAVLSFDSLTLGASGAVSFVGGGASATSAFQEITGTSLTNNGVIQATQDYACGLIYATTLVNNGSLINASASGYTVEANDFTNTGLISASNNGGIGISGFNSFTNTGVINDSGGVAISSPNFVNNGVINISGANDYLSIDAPMGAAPGSPLQTMSGTGSINVAGTGDTLQFVQSQTIGQGTINLTGTGEQFMVVSAATNAPGGSVGATVTLGAGATINQTSGTATIGASAGGPGLTDNFVNDGAINLSAAGGSLTVSTTGFTNNGVVTVSNGDHLVIQTALDGSGVLALATGGVVEVAAAAAASDQVTFNDSQNNLLKLDAASSFAAVINGFAKGDAIDLTALSATAATWSNGVLAVSLAGGGVLDLNMAGAYAGTTFNVASDNAGGSLITIGTVGAPPPPPPPPPPGVLAGSFGLGPVAEGVATSGAVASFTDSNAADAAAGFTAQITWGDGSTSAGVVSGSNGQFSVSAPAGHVFAAEGTYAASVLVTRTADSAQLTVSGSVTATEADVFAVKSAPALAATAGQAFSGTVATFTDAYAANTAADLAATITWGDGTTSAGVVSMNGGVVSVSGGHTYAAAGTDAVSVTLSDKDGAATATAGGTAVVAAGGSTGGSSGGKTYTLTTKIDKVAGGAGDDLIVAAANTLSKSDVIDGGAGANTLQLSGGGVFNLALPTTLTNVQTLNVQEGAGAGLETVTLRKGLNLTVNVASSAAPGAGVTIVGAADSSIINLGAGADVVTLGSATETVHGGGGADTFNVKAATIGATIDGGTGASTLVVSGGGKVKMGANITNIATVNLSAAGSAWNFTANAIAGLVVNDLSAGNADQIHAGAAGQTLTGGSHDQTFFGFGSGVTTYADTAAQFNGSSIKSFSSGDVIDIAGLAFGAQTKVTMNPSGATSGDLNITVNGVLQAQVHVFGQFVASSFSAASDGHGGTLITDRPQAAPVLAAATH